MMLLTEYMLTPFTIAFAVSLLLSRNPVYSSALIAFLYTFLQLFKFQPVPSCRAMQVLHPWGKVAQIAHRAAAHDAPENTLAAIRKAAQNGATAVELDLEFTADGVPILMHDETVDRTTDGSGPLSQLTYRDLLKLNPAAKHRLRWSPTPLTSSTTWQWTRDQHWQLAGNPGISPVLPDVSLQAGWNQNRERRGEGGKWPAGYRPVLGPSATQAGPCKMGTVSWVAACGGRETPPWKAEGTKKMLFLIYCVFSFFLFLQVRQADTNIVTALTHRPWSLSHLGDNQTRFSTYWVHYWYVLMDIILDWTLHTILWDFCGISAFLMQKNYISPDYIRYWAERGVEVVAWTVNTSPEKNYYESVLHCNYITDSLLEDCAPNY
nr:PREDICTED: glycerophosphodiester phosphodiesterase 1 [Latimeria chalumnae]|eukprot:XP_014346053.1 PREDICTED: glycerophosphodiester phosphodiesterase 1 [Latimeria chalumnae]